MKLLETFKGIFKKPTVKKIWYDAKQEKVFIIAREVGLLFYLPCSPEGLYSYWKFDPAQTMKCGCGKNERVYSLHQVKQSQAE